MWGVLLLPVLLLVLAALRPLALPDEGRYADIGRWMFTSGDWLVPRLNGIPFLHKPPLLYWLQAEVFALVGVHVWAARWVTALHALLLITCIHLGMRHVQGETAARKATMVLGSSIGFLIGGQYIRRLPCQVDSLKLETFRSNTLGRNAAGGTSPRDSCGRYSL